jgi:hypothetical protein
MVGIAWWLHFNTLAYIAEYERFSLRNSYRRSPLRVRGMRIDHLRFCLIYLNIYDHNGITPRLFWDSLMGLFLRVFGGTGMRNLPHDAFEVLFGASDNDTVRFAERIADPDADKSSVSQYFSWGRDKDKDTASCL